MRDYGTLWKNFFIVCGGLLLCLTLGSAAAAHAQTARTAVVLVLGDSLSAGYGLPVGTGWVDLLRARLHSSQNARVDYTVVNASISGETSSGGLSRLPALLQQHRPAVVVIELGANDGLRGLPLDLLRNNLAQMIESSLRGGARVVLIGTQLPGNYGKAYVESFAALFPQLAKKYRISLVPSLFAKLRFDPTHFQPDRLHPNATAQALILDTAWPTLQPLLK